MDYDERLEHARDAEAEDDGQPLEPDAPGCFAPDGRPYSLADFLRTLLAPAPLTDNPGSVRYPGRMTAFPDTPDEDLF